MQKLYLIEATIKDSYKVIRKRLKAHYQENPKSKDSAEVVLSSIVTEVLGEEYWQFITDTGLKTFVSDTIIKGGSFPIKLYWVDTLYANYHAQGRPRIDKELVAEAISSWEKEKWEYFTKQNIEEYLAEPQLFNKNIGDMVYAITAWEWLHDSRKARQYFSDEFINDKELIRDIFFDGDRLRSSDEIEEDIDDFEAEFGTDNATGTGSTSKDEGDTPFGKFLDAFGLNLTEVMKDFDSYVQTYQKADRAFARRGIANGEIRAVEDLLASQRQMSELSNYKIVTPTKTNKDAIAKLIVDTVLRFIRKR